jgi:hypothetical protein
MGTEPLWQSLQITVVQIFWGRPTVSTWLREEKKSARKSFQPMGNKKIPRARRAAGPISHCVSASIRYFGDRFVEAMFLCVLGLKIKEAREKLKTSQPFFSYFCSFQPYHIKPNSN